MSLCLGDCGHYRTRKCFFTDTFPINIYVTQRKSASAQHHIQKKSYSKTNILEKSSIYCRSSWSGESGGDIVIHTSKISKIILQTSFTLPHVSHLSVKFNSSCYIFSPYFWFLCFKNAYVFLFSLPCPHTAHKPLCSDKWHLISLVSGNCLMFLLRWIFSWAHLCWKFLHQKMTMLLVIIGTILSILCPFLFHFLYPEH